MSTDSDSHYDVLGVASDAGKGVIREAYKDRLARAGGNVDEAARVRRAWQVLSDPTQRDRYDTEIGVHLRAPRPVGRSQDEELWASELGDEPGDDDEDDQPGTEIAVRGRGSRPPRDRTPRDRPPPRERPQGLLSTDPMPTPAEWPPGFHAPPPRARVMAMGIDLLVLALLLIFAQTVGGMLIDKAYPAQTDRIDILEDRLDRLDTRHDNAQESLDQANDKLDKAKDNDNSAKASDARAEVKAAQKKLDGFQNDIDKADDERRDLLNKIVPGQIGVLLATFALAMLYLGIPSVRNGQTFGKRMFQIRVVQVDGSQIGWRAVLRRYGIPLLVGLTLSNILGPVAFAVVLIAVLRWPRNPMIQGLHDRFADTIVVDG